LDYEQTLQSSKEENVEHFKMYIGGEFVDSITGRTWETIDPGTGIPFATVAYGDISDAEAAIDAARTTFDSGVWSGLDPQERSRIIMDFSDRLTKYIVRIASYESMDSGGIINRTGAEVVGASMTARNLAWYAAHEFKWHEEVRVPASLASPGRNYIRREPVGVCAGIIPWNFPFGMAMWKILHAVTMGNSIVLKPASDTPLSALIIAEVIAESKIPKGVVNIVTGPGSVVGEALCKSPKVDKIAFTGSTEVGRNIMKMGADTIKKVTLELGGKSANIILEDANMDLAVDGGLFGTFFHSGQICESGTRIIVHESIYQEYVDRFISKAAEIRIGYQLDTNTQMGPMVSEVQRATTEKYVKIGIEEGAQLTYGGKRPDGDLYASGFYYMPTVFTEVDNSMRIAQEEIFGPVVCIMPFKEDDEAVSIANDSIYGLAGGVFGNDIGRAERIAQRVKTGTMWINDYHSFADLMPFGGYKQSGIGRELGGYGLSEYTQIKRVHVCPHSSGAQKYTFPIMFDYPQPSAAFAFEGPTRVISGPDSIIGLQYEINKLNCSRAVIITDKGIRSAGLLDKVEKALGNVCAGVFDEVVEDSGYLVVDKAADFCKDVNADILVSLGGGSSIDTAKAVAIILTNGGKAIDCISIYKLVDPLMPHIAIPTTAGTGSEVSNIAVIKNEDIDRKFNIAEFPITPNVAILDPHMTVSLPRTLTAATGMDALSHAIDGMCSIMRNPVCTGHGLNAIRMIAKYLPVVVENGHDVQARMQMQIAAATAGWAFSIPSTILTHSLAHCIGAKYKVHHGTLCGLFLPHVMRFNRDYCLDELAMVAEAMGINISSKSKTEASEAAADAVADLLKKIGLPTRLSDLNIAESEIDLIALDAMTEIPTLANPRKCSPELIAEVVRGAF
jgi:aldehyde dehydrogenase (NAD+)